MQEGRRRELLDFGRSCRGSVVKSSCSVVNFRKEEVKISEWSLAWGPNVGWVIYFKQRSCAGIHSSSYIKQGEGLVMLGELLMKESWNGGHKWRQHHYANSLEKSCSKSKSLWCCIRSGSKKLRYQGSERLGKCKAKEESSKMIRSDVQQLEDLHH